MNAKQERFAREYVIDHNGAAAARRAGYAASRAKQTANRLLGNAEVSQLITELDEAKASELGVTAEWWMAQAVAGWEKCLAGAPKTDRNGELVFADGELVMTWPAMAGAKYLELIAKQAGMFVERSEVDVSGQVVYTLELDRDLDVDDDDG